MLLCVEGSDTSWGPKHGWDTTADPSPNSDDWFPEKLCEIISRTEAWWYVSYIIEQFLGTFARIHFQYSYTYVSSPVTS